MNRSPTDATLRQWWLPLLALAAVVYPPLLLTAPGSVVADTKTYLYLDPGRLLSRSLSMWDPHVGTGTVPHQQVGYLWPMGPYYWLMEQVGAPDWVAQRLWLGSILVIAGGGVLFLGRTWRWRPSAATAAAFVYALSPYIITLATRLSAILLPFAALPWLLALTIRALRTRGWRHPALFALVVATAGSVNATALLLVGLVPVGWIFYSVWIARETTRARAVSTATKIGLLTIATNLWWILALSVQATNGINIVEFSETARVVNTTSTAPEVLRGLGYWFAYGSDRLDPWVEPALDYTQQLWLIAVTFALPVLGMLSMGITRWRHRAFVIGLLLVGLVLAIGAYPWNGPPPVGLVIRAFLDTDIGLAMRSLPRAVPLIALASALGIGSLVGAAAEQVPRRGIFGSVAVGLLALLALPPLWTGGFAPDGLRRPEEIPRYWLDAAAHLDERDDGTRVLEIPGIDFSSYRWGNTVDPITPGLIDRPYVARELVPYGSPASADLLRAFDLRLQEGMLPPEAIAPVARLLGIGEIVTRNDLQYERHYTVRPRTLWDLVTRAPGLGTPVPFGPPTVNVASDEAPLIDETHLARDATLPEPPPVGVVPVTDAVPIVTTHADDRVVLFSGDGGGIVDAAAAGLLTGDELIRYSAALTEEPDFVRDELRGNRHLVVTDTNRKRGQRWTQLRYIEGYTEEADGGLLDDDPTDSRLDVQEKRPGTQTVAELGRLSVRATDYGTPIGYYTEDRPAHAADGDVSTSWRVAAFDDAVGDRLELTAASPVRTDRVRLLQPQGTDANRSITRVELRFDGEDPVRVALDVQSLVAPGQVIEFGERTFRTLSIEILADTAGRRFSYGGLTSVGFAEVDLAGLQVDEVIRMPSDLLGAAGFRSTRYPLSVLQTRVRLAATDAQRPDEESTITRVLSLPTARTFSLDGTVRLSTEAPTELLDRILGRPGLADGKPVVTADHTLPGGFRHLPSNALDGDPSTVWTSRFGLPDAPWLRVVSPDPVRTDRFTLTWVDDAHHSAPTGVEVVVDGTAIGTFDLAGIPAGAGLRAATIGLPETVAASAIDLRFSDIDKRDTINWYGGGDLALPIAVAEVDLAGLRVGAVAELVDATCRTDLVTIGGAPVDVRIEGTTTDALDGRGLDLVGCDDGVTVESGDVRFETAAGADTGLDVDQLLWSSPGLDGPPTAASTGPSVDVVEQDDTTVRLRISGAVADDPFWLVFGQSFNTGWQIAEPDIDADGPLLVNGYANGYLVTPDAGAFELTLRFVPQNRVDIGFLVSGVAVIGALLLALQSSREIRPAPIPRQEPLRRLRALTYEGALPDRRQAIIVGAIGALLGLALTNPVAALVLALVGGLSTRREGWRPLLTVAPAALLATVAAYVVAVQARNRIGTGLQWPTEVGRLHTVAVVAVLLLFLDVVIERIWRSGSHLD